MRSVFGAGDRAQARPSRRRRENSTIAERKLNRCRCTTWNAEYESGGYIFIDRAPFNRGVLEFGHESVIDFTRSIETALKAEEAEVEAEAAGTEKTTTTTTVDNRTYKLYRGE